MNHHRLVLGTVQLGMPYGINNMSGKPDFDSAVNIVRAAFDRGIARFDTAQAYGDSEEVLGRIFDKLGIGAQVKVYSKLHPGLDGCDEEAVLRSVDASLKRLKVDCLEGLLLHHEDMVQAWDKGLKRAFRALVIQGKVKAAGASFYTPGKCFEAMDMEGLDLFQVPSNIFDHRFEGAGLFEKARERGKAVFVRSVFLQGLLLMPLDRVPSSLQHALPYLKRLEQAALDMRLSRQALSLRYAAQRWPSAYVLFGAESPAQVIANAEAFSVKAGLRMDEGLFKDVPENILNPVLWSKT